MALEQHTEVLVKGLKFNGRHGAFESERETEQPFVADILAVVDMPDSCDDAMSHVVDYTEIANALLDLNRGKCYVTLEAFAADFCRGILQRFAGITMVEVQLRKLAPQVTFEVDELGVCVRMHRARAWGMEER